jgi:four helix bundle protein
MDRELTSEEIGKQLAQKTLREIEEAKIRQSRPRQLTRAWDDPKGYQNLAVWQNAALLRLLIRKFTEILPKSEYRLKRQLDDAARSVKRNIEEGWKRPTTSEYLQFIGYSQASLEEVMGDIRDCLSDGFIKSVPGSSLMKIGIDLGIFKGRIKGQNLRDDNSLRQPLIPLTVKGEPDEPRHPYCKPLKTLNSFSLTYEIFLELINKTDWLLRKLVGSLEQKLIAEKRVYEIAKARVRDKLNWKK